VAKKAAGRAAVITSDQLEELQRLVGKLAQDSDLADQADERARDAHATLDQVEKEAAQAVAHAQQNAAAADEAASIAQGAVAADLVALQEFVAGLGGAPARK
jgi:hypothetical protein